MQIKNIKKNVMSMDVVSVHVYLALSREMKNLQFNVAKELR